MLATIILKILGVVQILFGFGFLYFASVNASIPYMADLEGGFAVVLISMGIKNLIVDQK